MIVLSDEFYREILRSPHTNRSGSCQGAFIQSAALDLFMWLSYRCFTAREGARSTLWRIRTHQPTGSADYARPRKFREKLEGWLDLIRTMWPQCPASIDHDGTGLFVDRRMPFFLEEPMRTVQQRNGIWRLSLEQIERR